MYALKFNNSDDIWTLAKLAAAVSNRRKPAEAVEYAVGLLDEAQKKLVLLNLQHYGFAGALIANEHDELIETLKNIARHDKDTPMPSSFPATLKDFFKIIVCAKTEADATKRVRDFLRWEIARCGFFTDPVGEAASVIQAMKKADKTGGFFKESHWKAFGGHYLDWWKQEKCQKNRRNAKAKKPAKNPC